MKKKRELKASEKKVVSEFDTPAEIDLWIEARKKNFPTKANIEKKKKIDELRKAKGLPPKMPDNSNVSKFEMKIRKKVALMTAD